jgi:WD40 repeat protein
LVGRDRDMTDLQNCLEAECRAVGVFGAPGVGKSSLVANVTREYAALFDQVLWHSLQAAPPAREILDRWLAALGITPQTDRLSERLDLLIAFLARKRCLIVLDNAETVFDDSRAPQKPVDVDYSELLQRILTNPGRSTLIVTSTVRFGPFRPPITSGVVGIELRGLDVDSVRRLLNSGGVRASAQEAKQVGDAYSGNPQAILILSECVVSAYAGSLSRFLKTEQDLVSLNRFDALLERQLTSVSASERLLLFLLTTWHEPMSLETLHAVSADHIGFAMPISVAELVASLRGRHLLVDTAEGVTPSGFVLELTTNFLVQSISRELIEGRRDLIANCPLGQAAWPDRVRSNQRRFLLAPIVARIARTQGLDKSSIRRLLRSRLRAGIPETDSAKTYAVSNILQLLEASGDELTDLDLHDLSIHGADFRSSWLRSSNFTDADLAGSAFAECFGTLHAIALSRDPAGKYVAVGTALGRVLIWNRETGELIAARQNHSEIVRALCFSAAGQTLYSAGEDRRLVAWHFGSGDVETVENAHGNWIWRIDILDALGLLLTAGCDGRIRVWSTEPLQESTSLAVPSNWIWSFASAGTLLVCACEDGAIWSLTLNMSSASPVVPARLEARLDQPVKAITGVREDPHTFFLGSSDGVIHRLNVHSKQIAPIETRHRGSVRSIVQVGSAGVFASAGDDRVIRLWNSKGTTVRLLEGHTSRIWALGGHVGTKTLASAGDDNTARIWRTDGASHPERSVRGVQYSVRDLDHDGEGGLVAASGDDIVRRWVRASDSPEHVLSKRHARLVRARAIGVDYVVAADDGLLTVKTRTSGNSWTAHEGAIECLAVHSGRRLIATGGEDRVARIWSTDGKKLAELVYHRNRIWALAFSPDGKWIATGGGDHVVGLWNAETGALRTALSGHQGLVLAATWLRDDIFVTGGSDGTLRFWRIDDTNGQVTSERTIDLGFVIRSVVAGETDDAPVIAAGRDPQPTLGSRLVRIGRAGIASEPVTGTLPGAIRAMALSSATGKLYVGGDSTDVVELDPTADFVERRRLRIDGPYSSAVFVGALGLTEGQKVAIAELGGRF